MIALMSQNDLNQMSSGCKHDAEVWKSLTIKQKHDVFGKESSFWVKQVFCFCFSHPVRAKLGSV